MISLYCVTRACGMSVIARGPDVCKLNRRVAQPYRVAIEAPLGERSNVARLVYFSWARASRQMCCLIDAVIVVNANACLKRGLLDAGSNVIFLAPDC